MIEREWRIVRAARVAVLAAVACLAAACSASLSLRLPVALAECIKFTVCTQERDCACGWCPPYGKDNEF